MELTQAVRHRRMVRSFSDRPVDPSLVDRLLDDALRAPSAGHTRGTAWLLLDQPEQTAAYWAETTTEEWRSRSRRWPGLSRAPVVALSLASPQAYLDRYAEPDKAGSGLGRPPDGADMDPGRAAEGAGSGLGRSAGEGPGNAWPVPYWFGDAAFATMTVLLRATDAGLGACFLGNFRGEAALLEAFGVPDIWRLFGSVLLGHPDGNDHHSVSLDRPGPTAGERVHRGRW
ncbi:MAG TPA: nitroreductase family protein [Acidimicrobiales bacterium]|jgi:nitroreductase|nr:nitroreductase family protein [Acidimicrobiales bacterium]